MKALLKSVKKPFTQDDLPIFATGKWPEKSANFFKTRASTPFSIRQKTRLKVPLKRTPLRYYPLTAVKYALWLLSLAFLATGCDYFAESDISSEEGGQTNLVARAGTAVLYKADLAGLVPSGATAEDSTKIIEHFVGNWIKKELFIREAAHNVNIDLTEIERKVDNYRFTLISYEYQKQHIEQGLNKEVSAEEIETYYRENTDNFILKQNIVRGRYIKLALEAPKKREVKRWIKSNREQDMESLRSYCLQFANNYSLEDSLWLKFDEVIKNSPFNTISNKVQFLRKNRYIEETDSAYLYLFKIEGYKISNEVSPLEFVRDDIENIIINKRKVALAKSLENDIYERAKENKDFEIYR